MPYESARIDFGENGNGVAFHVFVGDLFGTPVGTNGGEFANDQAFNERLGRLVIRQVRSVISVLGICENDDLTGVGRIGGDFLLTGKGSVENYFSLAFTRVAIAVAAEDAPVFER